jgi:hypothetical protein
MTVVNLSPNGGRLWGLLLVTVRELGGAGGGAGVGAGGGAGVGAGGGAVDGLAPHHHQAGGRVRPYYSWNAKWISFSVSKNFPKNFSKEGSIYKNFVLNL